MPFIIVSREGDSVRLVSETAFERQEDAIGAITSALAAGALERGTGLLLLDMERALPVAVVQVAEPPMLRFDEPVEEVSEEVGEVPSLVDDLGAVESDDSEGASDVAAVVSPVSLVVEEASESETAEEAEEAEEAGVLDLVAETVPEPEPLIDLAAPLEVPVVELPDVELPNLPAEAAAEVELLSEADSSAGVEESNEEELQGEDVEDVLTPEALEAPEEAKAAEDTEIADEAEAEAVDELETADVVEVTEDAGDSDVESVEAEIEVPEAAMAAALDQLLGDARVEVDLEEVDEGDAEPASIESGTSVDALSEPIDLVPAEGGAEPLPTWPWDAAEPDESAQPEVGEMQTTTSEEPRAEVADEEGEITQPADSEAHSVLSTDEPPVAVAAGDVEETSQEDSGHDEAAVAEAEVIVEAEAVVAAMEVEDAGVADTPGYEAGDCDLSELTCTDCVYVNTCPNREERTPATCGSFQWTSV